MCQAAHGLLAQTKQCALEARAFSFGAQCFLAKIKKHETVEVRIDNTSVVAATRKGHAKSMQLNDELKAVLDDLAKGKTLFRVAYVASAKNPADEPSRGLSLTRAVVSVDSSGGGGARWSAISF